MILKIHDNKFRLHDECYGFNDKLICGREIDASLFVLTIPWYLATLFVDDSKFKVLT